MNLLQLTEQAKKDINELLDELSVIHNKATKMLESKDLVSLPKFDGKFTSKNIRNYLKTLSEYISDPIISKRRIKLKELGIDADKIERKVLINDTIDTTIRILSEIKKDLLHKGEVEKLFYNVLAGELIDWLNSKNLSHINEILEYIYDSFKDPSYTSPSDIQDMALKEHLVKECIKSIELNYFDRAERGTLANVDIPLKPIERLRENFNNISTIETKTGLIVTLDKALNDNNTFDREVITRVVGLIKDIEKYGADIKEYKVNPSGTLRDIEEELSQIKEDLEKRRKELLEELDFWSEIVGVFPRYTYECEYDLNELKSKITISKSKCKEKYHSSYQILEDIFDSGLYKLVEDMNTFVKNLERILKHVENIQINNKQNISKINDAANLLQKLDKINFKPARYNDIDEFINNAEEIIKKYNKMISDCQLYSKLLGERAVCHDKSFRELEKLLQKYEQRVKKIIGEDYPAILEFIKGDSIEIPESIDKKTLINFIKILKPKIRSFIYER